MSLSLVQWFGGKGGQLKDLLPLIPQTRGYVEPFGGGGAVLLNRPISPLEVYNDLNGDIVNLFRVMQDPVLFDAFARKIDNTLWSKDEFRRAIRIQAGAWGTRPEIERAWALYVIQNQGISGTHSKSEGNWSRSKLDNKNCDKWQRLKERLRPVHDRFMQVQIDSQDGLDCMLYWDAPDVTFYVDPPYVLDTRKGSGKQYEHEMENTDHVKMVEVLLQLQGPVVLSGYSHPIYDPLVDSGWELHEYRAKAHSKVVCATEGGTKPSRIEAVWRNPGAMEHAVQRRLW